MQKKERRDWAYSVDMPPVAVADISPVANLAMPGRTTLPNPALLWRDRRPKTWCECLLWVETGPASYFRDGFAM